MISILGFGGLSKVRFKSASGSFVKILEMESTMEEKIVRDSAGLAAAPIGGEGSTAVGGGDSVLNSGSGSGDADIISGGSFAFGADRAAVAEGAGGVDGVGGRLTVGDGGDTAVVRCVGGPCMAE